MDEYNKYKSFIEYRYNNIETLHTIVNDVFKYFQMIAYHKYANYDTVKILLSFDFGKFMDNYFSDISGFIKKYDMLIGDEGKKMCYIKRRCTFSTE